MSDSGIHIELAEWLKGQLEHGIRVTEDVLHYMEATFGTDDLSSLLDDDAGDLDSLMELLFFPDLEMQVRFEGRWGHEVFTPEALDEAIKLLSAALPVAELAWRDAGEPIRLIVPSFVCRSFVQRLNIRRQIPEPLAQVVDTSLSDDIGLKVRVHLRNARLAWHHGQVDLIGLYLEKTPPSSPAFETDLNFLISIVPELGAEEDGYSFLIDKKFFYFRSLCSAEDFERRRASSNMEILMLSGDRSAHGSIDEWRRWMRRIDRICQGLYGRTQFFQQPDHQSIDLEGGPDIQEIVRKLS